MKKYTNVKDCEGNDIFEGDLIECSCPIFIKPKRFRVEWSEAAKSYNIPKNEYIFSYCKKITDK